jgi:hypothetical protein
LGSEIFYYFALPLDAGAENCRWCQYGAERRVKRA